MNLDTRDWFSQTDIRFPEPEELCKRVLASHEICLEDRTSRSTYLVKYFIRHQIKDIVTLRANRLQPASHPLPSEDAGSWAERSRVQSSTDNDPCSADVKVPSSYHSLFPQTAYSATELQQWSDLEDLSLNTIPHDHSRSKSLSKPEKKENEGKGEVSKLTAVLVKC